ncbi:MAG: peroxiredoxin [Alphaproteobacteria bacterium]|nr:peroxiredoxin [Alphaproteobacteria bacterium]
MTIKVGDKLPDVGLQHKTADGIDTLDNAALFAGKKVVLFAVPGAFTPTCSAQHVPSFVKNAEALEAKGVDTVACVSVNDPFVMGVWGKDQASDGKVMMLADGSAKFTKAVGLELDLTERGLGVRSQRYAMVVEDGTVTQLFVEEPGAFEVSSAEHVLAHL